MSTNLVSTRNGYIFSLPPTTVQFVVPKLHLPVRDRAVH